jgi:hypothetical protein
MKKKTLNTKIGTIAVLVAFVALPAAPGQAVVPPGNSAVNQYTETFPTVRGAEATKKGKKRVTRSPVEALGADKARKLTQEGAVGREVAAVVAATAPNQVRPPGHTPDGAGHGKATKATPSANVPDGSSGLSEVVAQATGSSDSGEMGILLPLLILVAIVGSAFYVWRQRRQAA